MSMRESLRRRLSIGFPALAFALLAAITPGQTQITVQYYRGVCTVGAVGAPCNVATDCGVGGACGVTAAVADDVTVLSWPAGILPFDIYVGPVPSYDLAGMAAGGPWTLNVAGCFIFDVLGGTVAATQVVDPNPAVGAIVYYVHSEDGGPAGLPNTNFFGCARPGACNNLGWCELGATPGAPCDVPVDCGAGICAIGTCVAGAPATLNKGCFAAANCGAGGVCEPRTRGTTCSTDAGPAGFGGCAAHSFCVGGADAGRLCVFNGDCPGGGTCPPVPPTATTPGQFCYNATGPVPTGCPPVGAVKRLERVIPVAVIAACP